MSTSIRLNLDVLVASAAGLQTTSTLVYGQERSVLIDAQNLPRDAQAVVDHVEANGRRLTAIYITHAHADHYWGLSVLRQAFPKSLVMTAPEVIDVMTTGGGDAVTEWLPHLSPEAAAAQLPTFTSLDDGLLSLEGHTLRTLHIGQGDMMHSTMMHIPSQEILIAGDMVANGTHLWLGETNPYARYLWMRNLQGMQLLEPKVVVAGRKARSNPPDDPKVIQETIDYLRDFDEAVAKYNTPDDVIACMLDWHGDREVPVLLERSAKAVFDKTRFPTPVPAPIVEEEQQEEDQEPPNDEQEPVETLPAS